MEPRKFWPAVPLIFGAVGSIGVFTFWWIVLQVTDVDLLTFSVFFVIPAGGLLAGMGCAWAMYRAFEQRLSRPPFWADVAGMVFGLVLYCSAQKISFDRSAEPTFSAFLLAREDSFWVGVNKPPKARHIDLSRLADSEPSVRVGLQLAGWVWLVLDGAAVLGGVLLDRRLLLWRYRVCPRCHVRYLKDRLLFIAPSGSGPEVEKDLRGAIQDGRTLDRWRESWREKLKSAGGSHVRVRLSLCADTGCKGAWIALWELGGTFQRELPVLGAWLEQARR